MKDSVIIVSGGMDSITLLHEKAEEIALAVTFDYGSNHNKREAECAARHCQQLGIEHIIIPLAFIGQYFKSSLLEGADAVPEGHYEAENMKSTVVPFRNGIMLSVACGLAESRKLSKVLIANHGGDMNAIDIPQGGESYCYPEIGHLYFVHQAWKSSSRIQIHCGYFLVIESLRNQEGIVILSSEYTPSGWEWIGRY